MLLKYQQKVKFRKKRLKSPPENASSSTLVIVNKKQKNKGCKNLHPAERCVLINCTNKDCPKKHQKLCRYQESCKFQKDYNCEYLHKAMVHCDNENENNRSKDQAEQLKQVTEQLF